MFQLFGMFSTYKSVFFKETGSILVKIYRHIVLKAFIKILKIIVGTDVEKKKSKIL